MCIGEGVLCRDCRVLWSHVGVEECCSEWCGSLDYDGVGTMPRLGVTFETCLDDLKNITPEKSGMHCLSNCYFLLLCPCST